MYGGLLELSLLALYLVF